MIVTHIERDVLMARARYDKYNVWNEMFTRRDASYVSQPNDT